MLTAEKERGALNMRRVIAVLLLCLLFAGCVANPAPTSPEQSASMPQTEPTAPPTEPAETEFVPSVPPTFLSKPIDPDDPSSAAYLQSSYGNAVETERGLFCFRFPLLYHAEPGSTELRPFCGVSACSHDGEDCEAWFEMRRFQSSGRIISSGLGYCDGQLWLVLPDPDDPMKNELLCVDPETRRRETVRETPLPEYSRQPEWIVREYSFHKDKLFERVHAGDNLPLEELQFHLYVTDLRTGETAEPFTALFEQQLNGQFIQPYLLTALGNQLYSKLTFYHEEIINGEPLTVAEEWLTRLDPQTGAWEKLVNTDFSGGGWLVEDNVVYVSEHHGVFLEYDTLSGELRQLESGLDVIALLYDREHVYCMSLESSHLYILDRAYRLLKEVELPENRSFGVASGNTVYIQSAESVNSTNWSIDCRLDVSEAGKGELTLEPLKWRETQ